MESKKKLSKQTAKKRQKVLATALRRTQFQPHQPTSRISRSSITSFINPTIWSARISQFSIPNPPLASSIYYSIVTFFQKTSCYFTMTNLQKRTASDARLDVLSAAEPRDSALISEFLLAETHKGVPFILMTNIDVLVWPLSFAFSLSTSMSVSWYHHAR